MTVLKWILYALVALVVAAVVAGQLGLLKGKAPTDLGVRDGRLKAPSTTNNSVSSQAQLWPGHPQRESWPWRLRVYALGEPSAQVPGAREGVFPALSRSVTADSDAGVQMFATMGCRLQRGQETLLLNSGCGFVPGLMQAMGEYDVVAVVQGQLFCGDRAGDLTKARPAKLTPYPLRRLP